MKNVIYSVFSIALLLVLCTVLTPASASNAINSYNTEIVSKSAAESWPGHGWRRHHRYAPREYYRGGYDYGYRFAPRAYYPAPRCERRHHRGLFRWF